MRARLPGDHVRGAAADAAQVADALGGDAHQARPPVLVVLGLHSDREVLVGHRVVPAGGEAVVDDPVELAAQGVVRVGPVGHEGGLLDSLLVHDPVDDADLQVVGGVEAVEELRVLLDDRFLLVGRCDHVVDVGQAQRD